MMNKYFRYASQMGKDGVLIKAKRVDSIGSVLAFVVGVIALIVMGSQVYGQFPPPQIIRTNPVKDRVFNKNASRCDFPQTIDVTFDKPIDPASLALDNFYALPQSDGCQLGQLLVAGVCIPYDPCLNARPTYSQATRTASINFVMTEGFVFVFVNGGIARCGASQQPIRGEDGQVVDGDSDGKPGGTYVFSYRVVSGPRVAEPVKKKKK